MFTWDEAIGGLLRKLPLMAATQMASDMAKHLVVYSLIHQPRRVRLPARPIPSGATPTEMAELLFDPELDKH